MYETIILEKKDRIAKIILNRPAQMNAINTLLRRELDAAVAEAEEDGEIDVLILTGAGKAFCAGLDLKELGQTLDAVSVYPTVWDRLRHCSKPTIAAVNGYAITGGFEFVLCCDIAIASENARFADTHSRVGILPGGGMTQILPRLVGIRKAKEMSFTGNFLTAQEALQLGLVNRVVPAGELDAAAEALARDIISVDQVALRKIKTIIDRGEGMTLDDAMMMERYEHMLYQQGVTSEEIERRRTGIMERGRAQTKA